jgi:UPF0755 protein
MLKKFSLTAIVVTVALIIIGVGAIVWYQSQIQAPTTSSGNVRFVIAKGSSASKIANDLASEGIIKSALAFRIYTQVGGLSDKIFAGEFSLPKNLTVPQLVEKLRQGPSELWVTIPEGLRREEVAQTVAKSLNKDQEFINQFLALTVEDEGYLFPDTYLFPKDVTVEAVVSKLKNTFESKVDFPITPDQVNLASILERETKNASTEGPVVAGILLKRISAGWPIQADATVQYALASAKCKDQSAKCDWWSVPTRADYEFKSPYNTYLIQGFPPTPIASPGLAALKAAANPEDSQYWYYIHGNDGKIYFAKTLEEHNQNVERYIK